MTSSTEHFWTEYQPGFRFTAHERGTPEFYADIEQHRYRLEPHIAQFARFQAWAGRDVLEAGCGIGTDAVQFARAGARYTGIDQSDTALQLAQRRFELEGCDGTFVQGPVTDLPFPDANFDLVYSFGVIHHEPNTERAVQEFHRVLRPGGTALVMLYHRRSLNYHVNILLLRRALVGLLALPRARQFIARVTGEDSAILEAHAALLREHGIHYLTDVGAFLSNNTDGPGNPLSKVYSRRQAYELFSSFARVRMETHFLNLRIYPSGQRLAATRGARCLERRYGWHLCIEAQKGA